MSSALALSATLAMPVSAQTTDLYFSDLYVFGDSLSDTGNIIPWMGFTDGNTAVENIAEELGIDLIASEKGGNNYAVGGHTSEEILCSITSETGCTLASGGPVMFESFYQRTGGVADPDALYTIIGGGNDVHYVAKGDRTGEEVADNLVASADALDSYGAQYIIMSNTPDVGMTPGGDSFKDGNGNYISREDMSEATDEINSELEAEAKASDSNILLLDLNLLLKEVMADPRAFGFNLDPEDAGSTCMVGSPVPCEEGNTGDIVGDNPEDSIFWDGLHPSSAMHQIASDQIISTVYAAAEVGMMPIMGYGHSKALTGSVQNEVDMQRWKSDEVGQVRYFGGAGAEKTITTLEGTSSLGDEDRDSIFASLGMSLQLTETLTAGAAILTADSNQELNQSDYALGSIGVSAFLAGRQDNIFYNVTAAYTDLDFYENERTFNLGSTMVRTETSETRGKVYGATVNAGIALYEDENVRLGPIVSTDLYKVEIDGFEEDGLSSTTMVYEAQEEDIVTASAGFFFDVVDGQNNLNVEVRYTEDFKDDETNVVYLGAKSLDAGTAYLPGYNVSGDVWTLDINYGREISEDKFIYVGYEFSKADQAIDEKRISVGFSQRL